MTDGLSEMARRCVTWLFRNRRTGQLTIAQVPNAALWIVIACVAGDRLFPGTSGAHRTVDWLGVSGLSWWAVDEIIRGVNPWRRFLGLAGSALVVAQVTRLAR